MARPPWQVLDLNFSAALDPVAVNKAFSSRAMALHPDHNTGCLKFARTEFIAAKRAQDTLLALSALAVEVPVPRVLQDVKSSQAEALHASTATFWRPSPSTYSSSSSSLPPGTHGAHGGAPSTSASRPKAVKIPQAKKHAKKHSSRREGVRVVGTTIPLLIALERWLNRRLHSIADRLKHTKIRLSPGVWWTRAKRALGKVVSVPRRLTSAALAWLRANEVVLFTAILSASAIHVIAFA